MAWPGWSSNTTSSVACDSFYEVTTSFYNHAVTERHNGLPNVGSLHNIDIEHRQQKGWLGKIPSACCLPPRSYGKGCASSHSTTILTKVFSRWALSVYEGRRSPACPHETEIGGFTWSNRRADIAGLRLGLYRHTAAQTIHCLNSDWYRAIGTIQHPHHSSALPVPVARGNSMARLIL
jgi:hypothetical protein